MRPTALFHFALIGPMSLDRIDRIGQRCCILYGKDNFMYLYAVYECTNHAAVVTLAYQCSDKQNKR